MGGLAAPYINSRWNKGTLLIHRPTCCPSPLPPPARPPVHTPTLLPPPLCARHNGLGPRYHVMQTVCPQPCSQAAAGPLPLLPRLLPISLCVCPGCCRAARLARRRGGCGCSRGRAWPLQGVPRCQRCDVLPREKVGIRCHNLS